jgi:co-chaperonin GroES (HSP10)
VLRPLGARALVKRLDTPKPQSQLIEIPDTIVDKPSVFGLVLAIGKLEQGGFDVGDTVILKDYVGAPTTVELAGERIECVVVNENEVLAVVDGL